ncbi:hypothetical protein [Actinoplanes sp. GCM10030250]|uniref:hypothetical protein n=1 Tax=Actinoplanes sp. GCM10030250 TaxID=3273376 RepID=UPI00361E784F
MEGIAATVSYDGRRWTLGVGERLTVGRSSSCTVRLPDDGHLSRRAASVDVLGDGVLVRNTSGTKPFVLRPPAGEDQVVVPGAATSLPHPRFEIVLAGSRGDVTVRVDSPAARAGENAASEDAAAGEDGMTRSGDTFTGPGRFSAAQHRVMVELCRPLMVSSGPSARPATYAEIGERLGLNPHYVRNVLKGIRESLTGYGVPGLVGEQATAEDFRLPLARCALWNGWVGPADLEEGE